MKIDFYTFIIIIIKYFIKINWNNNWKKKRVKKLHSTTLYEKIIIINKFLDISLLLSVIYNNIKQQQLIYTKDIIIIIIKLNSTPAWMEN